MQLEKIEMSGFKSFADKTTIEFDKGVTAVVGPNGSGKSNLSEAIKWVLGEQSAKSLRGKRMDDVIFAGSQTRKPVNIAEVNLYINNEDKVLATDQTQVVLTRRLNRNGASDFLINKKPVRLKDITDLMMDSGLGKDSFALISQGKVEQIFNEKPEERRMIIEEAAGVLKYKDRKNQAQRKLNQTQDHLNRVEDILHEIEGQLAPLEEQREKAIAYVSKKEQLEDVETALLAVEIETLNAQWKVALQEVEQLQEQLAQTEATLESLQVDIEENQVKLEARNEELDAKQEEYVELIQKVEQLDGQRKVFEQRRQFAERSDEENQEALAAALRELEEVEEKLVVLEKNQVERKVELKNVEEAWSQLVEELDQLSQSNEESVKELQNRYIEQLQEISRLLNQEKNLEKAMEVNQNTQEKMTERFDSFDEEHRALEEKANHFVEKIEELTKEEAASEKRLSQLREKLAKVNEKHATLSSEGMEKERHLQQLQATVRSLKQVSEDYAGYYQGVREVLKHKTDLPGVVNSVAELIRVEEQLTTAIDIALGATSQHIVVTDEKAAAKAITYLKTNRLGRATFLPLSIIKEKQVPDTVLNQAKKVDGFIGIASELVSSDKKYVSIIKNLLGTTLVTTNLQVAQLLAKQLGYRYRIVSLEGDVVNAGGSMTGGASKNSGQQSLVRRNSQLETVTKQFEEAKAEYEKLSAQFQKVTAEKNKLEEEYRELNASHTQLEQTLNQLEFQSRFALEEVQKHERIQQANQFEMDELIEAYEQLEEQYVENHEKLVALQKTNASLKKELDYLQLSNEDKTQQIQEKQKELQELGTNRARVQEQFNQEKREIHQTKLQKTRLEDQIELLHSKKSEQSRNQEEDEAIYAKIQEEFDALKGEVDELDALIKELRDERAALEIHVKQSEASRTQAQHQLQDQLKNQTRLETKANRFEISIDQKLTYLSEEYELTFEAAIAKTTLDMSIEEASKLVRSLKQQIEQMGAVNLLAIEEFEAVQERFTFLTAQQQDLLEAKQTLEETITEMDEEVTTRFKTTFDAVSTQFERTFPRLFGGGRATLELTDPDNLLETGIEIIAQPPGKKLQSLSLLSGGERAFTAIALLFAILEVKPVPFCLLDEVEAALDEANVARYGRYLKEFTNRTQFIVITHRRGTMEEADVLYGVTMQESGVSKLASVKFEDFDELEEAK